VKEEYSCHGMKISHGIIGFTFLIGLIATVATWRTPTDNIQINHGFTPVMRSSTYKTDYYGVTASSSSKSSSSVKRKKSSIHLSYSS